MLAYIHMYIYTTAIVVTVAVGGRFISISQCWLRAHIFARTHFYLITLCNVIKPKKFLNLAGIAAAAAAAAAVVAAAQRSCALSSFWWEMLIRVLSAFLCKPHTHIYTYTHSRANNQRQRTELKKNTARSLIRMQLRLHMNAGDNSVAVV